MLKTPFLGVVAGILIKDVRAEFRSRELISTMALFAVLSILIFSFALELDRIARAEAIGGVLWVTVAFASILGLNRSLTVEREQGSFEAILIAPVDRTAIFFGKFLGNFVFSLAVGLLILPLSIVLYNVSTLSLWLVVTLFLGTLGLTGIGTLLAAMTVQTRARETLLPIVMLPLALPVVMAAVRATTGILSNSPLESWVGWVGMLVIIGLVYLAACFLTFDFVVEE